MAEQTLDIKIRTTADTTGATAAAASLKGVETATQRQAPAQKVATEQSLKGGEALEKLRNAASGGAVGIYSIIPALRGLGAAFLANPVTAGIAAFLLLKDYAAAAGNAIGGLIVRGREHADALKGQSVNAAVLAAGLANIKTQGDTALAKIAADAKEAADDLARFNSNLDQSAARLDKLADAATKAKLAELDLAEAQSLALATTEGERVGIRSAFGDQRAAVRKQAEEDRFNRTGRIETQRAQTGFATEQRAQGELETLQRRVSETEAALAANTERNKGLRAGTQAATEGLRDNTFLRAQLATFTAQLAEATKLNEPIIAAARLAQQTGKDNLTINAADASVFRNTTAATAITETGTRATALQAASEADALTAAGVEAGRVGVYARNIANGAPGDIGLGAATSAVQAAVKAAQADGTTREEVQALIAATQDLGRELALRNQESAADRKSVV